MIKFTTINCIDKEVNWEYKDFNEMRWAVNNIIDIPGWDDEVIYIDDKKVENIRFEDFYNSLQ